MFDNEVFFPLRPQRHRFAYNMSLSDEFQRRARIVLNHTAGQDSTPRLIALYDWMIADSQINPILAELNEVKITDLIEESKRTHMPPKAGTEDEIAAVGLAMVNTCKVTKWGLFQVAIGLGIRGRYNQGNIHECSEAAMEAYVLPFLNYVLHRLPVEPAPDETESKPAMIPAAIQESLARFRAEYPDPRKVAFIIMRFGNTTAHTRIESAIKKALADHNLQGFLARDNEFSDDLYPNIKTYMHGCGFAIAVFERITTQDFNPNVSLEVGYMMALGRPVLLLKDQSLETLHTDLVGKLYRSFDVHNPEGSIPGEISQWLRDRKMI